MGEVSRKAKRMKNNYSIRGTRGKGKEGEKDIFTTFCKDEWKGRDGWGRRERRDGGR
jgi:hypothetical protein